MDNISGPAFIVEPGPDVPNTLQVGQSFTYRGVAVKVIGFDPGFFVYIVAREGSEV